MPKDRPNPYALDREDAAALAALVVEHVPPGDIVTSRIAAELYGVIKQRIEDGNEDGERAGRFADALAVEGLAPKIARRKHDLEAPIVLAAGEVVSRPLYQGHRAVDDDGVKEQWSQQSYIATVPRPIFDAIYDRVMAQLSAAEINAAEMNLYREVWDRHPEAKTLKEAWQLDGRDLAELGM